MSVALQLQLLGGMQVSLNGSPVRDFYSNKAPALLVFLAVTHREHTRDALAALFWGEMSSTDARTNLRQCLSNLRKLLGPYLTITRDTIGLDASAPLQLDVERFENLLREGREAASGDPSAAMDCLRPAVELYQGDFLAGVFVRDAPEFEEWAVAQRARLRESALLAMQSLTQYHSARGSYAPGIEYANRQIALDPWREETYRELMLMLARSGQRSAALQKYEVCRQVLAQEMGITPSAETTALYERIHAAGQALRHNLPPQPTSFVGREKELAHIEGLFLKRECRLLTILGAGGIGKTRLALETAGRALKIGAFLNGVVFAPLGDIHSTDLLIPAVAQAAGLSLNDQADPGTQLVNFLREKEILIILDNMEHLPDAAPWLGQILSQAPRVTWLVTSRERLNLRAEWFITLEGLEYPRDEKEQLANYAAVRLFIERARQVVPGFEPDDHLHACIARVCQLVEGLPLGIELASAWTNNYTCNEIAAEIERGYAFLTTAAVDAPRRQQSLRAVFDHSWHLLTAVERQAFQRLGVFRGGFRQEAAEDVAGTPHPFLFTLVDKSFLRRDIDGRFEMHGLLRQYSLEKLGESGEECQIRDRHSEYYTRFLRQREAPLKQNRHAAAVKEITDEIDNARVAWEWAVASPAGPRIDLLSQALEALFVYLEMRASFMEGERMFADAAAALNDANGLEQKDRARGIALGNMLARQAWFCFRLARFQQADELATSSLDLLNGLDAPDELGYPLLFAGACAFGRGDLAECQRLFLRSSEVYRRLDDAWGLAGTLNNLGQVATAAGKTDQAEQFIQEALAVARGAGIQHLVGHILNNLGGLRLALDDPAGARRALQESLAIARDAGEKYLVASTLNNLGAIALALHDPIEAEQRYEEAQALWREIGDGWALAGAVTGLGETLLCFNKKSEARQKFRAALELAAGIGATSVGLNALLGMATTMDLGDERSRALEIAAFVIGHCSAEQSTRERARQAWGRLAPGLSAPHAEGENPTGTTRDLREFVSELNLGE